jgi:hypothetical protein
MASRDDHSSASSFTLRVTGPAAPVASNPNREGGSVSTRPMASRDDHSSASSFTLRVTGPAARWLVTRPVSKAALVHGRWLRMTITRVLPRLHFGLLGLQSGGFASNPNRKGGSVSTRPMASHDDYSSASSFTLRVTGPTARWLVTRIVREAALVHGRWLRVTITRVLPRLHFGLLGLRPGG